MARPTLTQAIYDIFYCVIFAIVCFKYRWRVVPTPAVKGIKTHRYQHIYGRVSMKHTRKAKVHVWFPFLCDSQFCTNKRHHKCDAQNSKYLGRVAQEAAASTGLAKNYGRCEEWEKLDATLLKELLQMEKKIPGTVQKRLQIVSRKK